MYLSAKGLTPMGTLEPKAIIRRYYEEIGNRRHLAVADEIIDPQFRLFPDSSPPYGPEGVKQFITWLCITTFPDLQVTIEDLIAEGEQVAAFVTLHATQTTPIDWISGVGTIAPTGKPFALKEYVLWRVSAGKIVERTILVDTWSMLQQLKVLPVLGTTAT
jgi:predicted ester cyclase